MRHGAYILGCRNTRLSAAEKTFYAQARPWGFILFARNVENPDQLRGLCAELRACVGRAAPILIDQEGGRVARMGAPHWRQWMAPSEQVKMAGDAAARSMWLRYRLIGEELRDVGIDCNCAPVCDVAVAGTHPVLANRCYASDAARVSVLARAVAGGLADAGILPVMKHIPGHGRATRDSHCDVPGVDAGIADLSATDFAPFRALCDLPMAMTAHIIYNKIDDVPATVSGKTVVMIRQSIGFQGLLMSDDISMQALQGALTARAAAALAAGCDLVLHCNGDLDEMHRLAGALGSMTARAQQRADAALAARGAVRDIDIAACEAELQSLLGKGGAYV